MSLDPVDRHDGRSATDPGFTYRMVHIGAELVADVLGDAAVGFADQSHLTRWSNRYYGITPAAYRRAALGDVRSS